MSQKVVSVPNPRFSVPPLSTIAGDIVSRKRILVPVTNISPVFSGQRNSSTQTTQNFAYWDIADNESMLDLEKLVLVMDLTFHTFRELQPSFDQNTQALIWKLEIGTSQGLKIEEINNYNLWANAVAMYTQSAAGKERALLDYADFEKTIAKAKDFNPNLDSVYYMYGQSAITAEHPYRIHLRIHHSSFMANTKLIPLFLYRNGIRLQVYFESVYKAFALQHGTHPQKAINIKFNSTAPYNFMITPGPDLLDGNQQGGNIPTIANAANAAAVNNLTYLFPTLAEANRIIRLNSNVNRVLTARKIYNGILLHQSIYKNLISGIDFPELYSDVDLKLAFPFQIHHKGQMVFSGFFWFTTVIPHYSTLLERPSVVDTTAKYVSYPANSLEYAAARNLANLNYFTIGTNVNTWSGTVSSTAGDGEVDACFAGALTGFVQAWIDQFPPEGSTPYMGSQVNNTWNQADVITFLADARCELAIQKENYFIINRTSGAITPQSNRTATYIDPLLYTWSLTALPSWTYELKNLQMIADLIKPSAESFMKFQDAYMSPSGIPYKFKRIIYRKTTFRPQTGMLTINMQVSVRSMSGILLILQDPKCDNEPTDSTKFKLPCLSSFFRKGLSKAEVVVGGQMYPVYQLYFKPNYDTSTSYCESHLLETENFFGVGSSSFNPSFSLEKTKYTRNYNACGLFDKPMSTWNTAISGRLDNLKSAFGSAVTLSNNVQYSDPFPKMSNYPYLDASSFVVAFSLQKDDINNFATGIDSSQSGAVNLNLYFQDPGYGDIFGDNIDCHTFITCDAVFTKQNDADLIRY